MKIKTMKTEITLSAEEWVAITELFKVLDKIEDCYDDVINDLDELCNSPNGFARGDLVIKVD